MLERATSSSEHDGDCDADVQTVQAEKAEVAFWTASRAEVAREARMMLIWSCKEIWRLICDNLDLDDLVHLMTVNKSVLRSCFVV